MGVFSDMPVMLNITYRLEKKIAYLEQHSSITSRRRATMGNVSTLYLSSAGLQRERCGDFLFLAVWMRWAYIAGQ